MPRNTTDYAKPAGPCPNPECTVTETKTTGLVTDATEGMPRINRTKGGCTRCLGTGKTKKANPKFKWTPGTLAVAVGIGMKKLDGLPITHADADFSHALAEDDARAAAAAAKEAVDVAA